MKKKWNKIVACALALGVAVSISSCGTQQTPTADKPLAGTTLKVYNWGEYIDEDVIGMFEEETGIKVIYDTFETNEDMYTKIKSSGTNNYDVCIPSDYMIKKMIDEDMLEKIDFNNVPNYSYIDKKYTKQTFDPNDEYSVPYMWGTVGIAVNKEMVSEPIDSWQVLWDPKYKKQILGLDSERDAVGLTLKALGYSLNSTDPAQLEEAKQKLIEQKPNILAYVGDQVKDKMLNGEAAMALLWSGDGITLKYSDDRFDYVLPKEGTNFWIDSIVILKGTQNKAGAEAFINFLCRPDIGLKNAEYIGYCTPNTETFAQLDDELKNDKSAYPDEEYLSKCEIFENLADDEIMQTYSKIWLDVLSE